MSNLDFALNLVNFTNEIQEKHCFFFTFLQKNAEKFAHVKKKQYLCTRFRKKVH